MNILSVSLAVAILVFPAAPALAQAKTMTAQEQTNLKLVSDWWREVIQAGHTELAPKYMAEDYIQHNPNISTGRAAFVQVFSRRGARDIQAALDPAPVIQFAKGPYVVFVWEREAKDPKDGSTYKYNFFDVVRVENNRVVEHWDSVFRPTPQAGSPPPAAVIQGVGPRPVKPRNTPEEQKNEDLANVEYKDILQYGHVELADKVLAPDYIQHNPNVPTGRAAFVDFFRRIRKPEPIRPEWKDEPELVITSGNLVLHMFRRFSADPVDPSKVYKWNWFDLVRVDDGLVQEHWDMAMKTPSPAVVAKPASFKEYR